MIDIGGPVTELATRLNKKYNLNGKRKLSWSTLYRAVDQGKVGESPCKLGPQPKIPEILLEVVATHCEISQAGNGGELNGRDIRRLMTAAVLDTKYDEQFNIESAWRKLRTNYPDCVQAANSNCK